MSDHSKIRGMSAKGGKRMSEKRIFVSEIIICRKPKKKE